MLYIFKTRIQVPEIYLFVLFLNFTQDTCECIYSLSSVQILKIIDNKWTHEKYIFDILNRDQLHDFFFNLQILSLVEATLI